MAFAQTPLHIAYLVSRPTKETYEMRHTKRHIWCAPVMVLLACGGPTGTYEETGAADTVSAPPSVEERPAAAPFYAPDVHWERARRDRGR